MFWLPESSCHLFRPWVTMLKMLARAHVLNRRLFKFLGFICASDYGLVMLFNLQATYVSGSASPIIHDFTPSHWLTIELPVYFQFNLLLHLIAPQSAHYTTSINPSWWYFQRQYAKEQELVFMLCQIYTKPTCSVSIPHLSIMLILSVKLWCICIPHESSAHDLQFDDSAPMSIQVRLRSETLLLRPNKGRNSFSLIISLIRNIRQLLKANLHSNTKKFQSLWVPQAESLRVWRQMAFCSARSLRLGNQPATTSVTSLVFYQSFLLSMVLLQHLFTCSESPRLYYAFSFFTMHLSYQI
jgi:hypothetical protein